MAITLKTLAPSMSVRKSGQNVMERLRALTYRLFPNKTAVNLAAVAGISERTARRFLGGYCDLSFDAVQSWLHHPEGEQVLTEIMADAKAKWWQRMSRRSDIAELSEKIEEVRQSLSHMAERPLV